MATKSIRVRATQTCFINGHRRKPGAEFFVVPNAFCKGSMVKVGEEKPEATSGEEAVQTIDEMTVKQLKVELAKKGISAPAGALKDALAALLKGAEGLNEDEGKEDDNAGDGEDEDLG